MGAHGRVQGISEAFSEDRASETAKHDNMVDLPVDVPAASSPGKHTSADVIEDNQSCVVSLPHSNASSPVDASAHADAESDDVDGRMQDMCISSEVLTRDSTPETTKEPYMI